jgi:hypothetical protein
MYDNQANKEKKVRTPEQKKRMTIISVCVLVALLLAGGAGFFIYQLNRYNGNRSDALSILTGQSEEDFVRNEANAEMAGMLGASRRVYESSCAAMASTFQNTYKDIDGIDYFDEASKSCEKDLKVLREGRDRLAGNRYISNAATGVKDKWEKVANVIDRQLSNYEKMLTEYKKLNAILIALRNVDYQNTEYTKDDIAALGETAKDSNLGLLKEFASRITDEMWNVVDHYYIREAAYEKFAVLELDSEDRATAEAEFIAADRDFNKAVDEYYDYYHNNIPGKFYDAETLFGCDLEDEGMYGEIYTLVNAIRNEISADREPVEE